jgi:hypothetical protein
LNLNRPNIERNVVMKNENPAFQFYIKDWLTDPQLRMASFRTKGIWIDLLCYMWKSPCRGEITGSCDQIRKLLGADTDEFLLFLDEASTLRFCDISVTGHNNVTDCHTDVTITNRRMYNEEKVRRRARERQRRKRERDGVTGESRDGHDDVTPASPSPTPSPVQKENKFSSGDPPLDLSEKLQNLILKNNPNFKKKNLQKWAVHVDRMIRLDNRDPGEIYDVITWCQQDDFWSSNILSTSKLRKQFDQLFIKMKKDYNPYGV